MSIEAVEASLRSNGVDGLAPEEAEHRLQQDGPNALPVAKGKSFLLLFLDQFKAPLVVILLIAAGITILLGGFTDAAVILAVVVLNALIGSVQEGRAVRELSALSRSVETAATVLRRGRVQRIPSTEIVVGDVVMVEAGDRVPADIRVTSGKELSADEAALTGESTPVEKQHRVIDAESVMADRSNILHASSVITTGTGKGFVVSTGTNTEIGRVSELIAEAPSLKTPLTISIERFSTWLLWGIVVLALATFGVGMLRGETMLDMVLASVALAVGAIPEGLPAAVTIILAIGVARMAKQRSIIRQLPAVETLGSTTVICSDKTGTLTQNQMTVSNVVTAEHTYEVTGGGFDPSGSILPNDIAHQDKALHDALECSALCGTASVEQIDGVWKALGDPTEAALVVVAYKGGISRDALSRELPQIDVVPFSSEQRLMATLHRRNGETVLFAKGSVEAILDRASQEIHSDGSIVTIDKDRITAQLHEHSSRGRRVMATAMKVLPASTETITAEDLNNDLVFTSMVAMIDPPRPEARDAIAECKAANVSVKMITGDHVVTARAIAEELGVGEGGSIAAHSGAELSKMSDGEFKEAVREGSVFARVSPEQKVAIVEELQRAGNIVAMTGDGVNDAPALKRANIGVAMGKSGTDVAKDASDMVLTDDNFVSIVRAVKEGRIVFENLLKFIVWAIPTNIGEGMVILIAIGLGLSLPILPVQILWVNMITAVVLGLPLAFEPGTDDVMKRKPRDVDAPLLSLRLLVRTLVAGSLLVAGVFLVYTLELNAGHSVDVARTAAANALVVMEAFYLFNCRRLALRSNPSPLQPNMWLWFGIGVTAVLQMLFTYVPVMQTFFKTAAIGWTTWLITIASGIVLLIVIEIEKRIRGKLD